MLHIFKEIAASYEIKQKPQEAEKSLASALAALNIETGLDTSTDQYNSQEALSALQSNSVWVYRCVDFIASNLSRLDWKFYKDETEVTDNDVFSIFLNPNKFQTKYDFLYESIARLMLQGEMFWELDRRNSLNGQVVGIYADWRSEEITIKVDKQNGIQEYHRMLNGKLFKYSPDQVFYIWNFNQRNPIRGLSPLQPARHSAEMDFNAISYNKGFFKQGARPSGIFSTPEMLNTQTANALQERLRNKYQNVQNMHELIVLWGGLKYEALNNMSMTDLQFKDLRHMNREEIIATYGLSLEVFGLGEKTYQNVQFYRRMAWTESLIPKMEKIEALLNKNFLPLLMEGVELQVNYDNVDALREERSKKIVDYERGFKSAAVTPNDIRQDVFGKEPIETEEMNSTYIWNNLGPVVNENGEEILPQAATFTRIGTVKKWTYEDRTKIWLMKINQINPHERIYLIEIRKIFNEMEKEILSRVNLLFKKEKQEDDSITIPPSLVIRASNRLYDAVKWKTVLESRFAPLMLATIIETGSVVATAEGVQFDAQSPLVRQLLGQRVRNFSTFVNTSTDQHIKKAITIALQETAGMSVAEQTIAVKHVLKKYFDDVAATTRAALIARTEAYAAANAGTYAGAVLARFPRKMWITSRDDRVRDSHQIDGQVVGIDNDFVLADGSAVPFPQDFNERCIMIPTNEPISF